LTRLIAFLYGLVAYVVFLVTACCAIGLVGDLIVPGVLETGGRTPFAEAIVVDLLLISLFAIQQSEPLRKRFRQWSSRFFPPLIGRSTQVLAANLTLLLLLSQWRTMPAVVWQIDDEVIATGVMALSFFGVVIVFISSVLTNHLELFGLDLAAGSPADPPMPPFRTLLHQSFERDPSQLGLVVAFWSASTMTAGRLFFAVVTTALIVVGVLLERHDRAASFANRRRNRKGRVSMRPDGAANPAGSESHRRLARRTSSPDFTARSRANAPLSNS